ncbi:amino acid ABC transporter permease [Rossellomorea vietnamensis]|uniref:Amino acid ABC transporter permease n=1 Tax=Rossellomorea vietnamensis TaxID=218284 RepID=A0A5D4K806_9BACI|nr:amino acid ABC transporter permease [Rossellomorea vietnamensis]TYR73418.1 amino acid ABC transporter permease [Rossellomorea vietnamensis]
MEIFQEALPVLWAGLKMTAYITVLGLLFGFIIGLITALFRLSPIPPLRWIAIWFINFVRGTPFLVQLFFIYFGLNSLSFISFEPVTAGIVGIAINAGAYIAEIVRTGIQSIDKGQTEAARTLGLTSTQTMRYIVLPQALRRMLPTFVNQAIISLKDTSLLSVIGIAELTQRGQVVVSATYEPFKIWGMVALMYFVLIYLLTKLGDFIERRYELR